MGVALLMGFTAIGITGCNEKSETLEVDSGDPITETEPSSEPPYGVPALDADGDGFFANEDDCNDQDPDINPDADEIPDDGVDSNCDGEDNT